MHYSVESMASMLFWMNTSTTRWCWCCRLGILPLSSLNCALCQGLLSSAAVHHRVSRQSYPIVAGYSFDTHHLWSPRHIHTGFVIRRNGGGSPLSSSATIACRWIGLSPLVLCCNSGYITVDVLPV